MRVNSRLFCHPMLRRVDARNCSVIQQLEWTVFETLWQIGRDNGSVDRNREGTFTRLRGAGSEKSELQPVLRQRRVGRMEVTYKVNLLISSLMIERLYISMVNPEIPSIPEIFTFRYFISPASYSLYIHGVFTFSCNCKNVVSFSGAWWLSPGMISAS